jgi:hypothetical protein
MVFRPPTSQSLAHQVALDAMHLFVEAVVVENGVEM